MIASGRGKAIDIELFAVDLGESVDVTYRNTAELERVHVIQADLRRLPFRSQRFDRVYSLGVLHHLAYPFAGWHLYGPLARRHPSVAVCLHCRLALLTSPDRDSERATGRGWLNDRS